MWDVSSVTNMEAMFRVAELFNSHISKWDVSSVTNMHGMFAYASSFNSDISKWDVSSVITMKVILFYASSFDRTLCGAWKASAANHEVRKGYSDSIFYGSHGKMCG